MSTTVGTLTIEMVANIARLQKGMDAAMSTVDTSMGKITKTVETAMRTMGTLFAGVSVGVLASKLVSVQREFDVLNSSLITVTGSSEAAEKAFALLEDFASTTPFSLAEVTRAFTKLKAMGLDPSAEALRSYGNTASAMGKSLNDMIEAVADAATGEFERLKEFGIKAKSEGDRVTFTFKGLSTTIGKNSAEIEAYLRRIGDVDFAGATELRAKTLDGALSNLGDTYDKLFRTISSGDIGGVISDGVRLAIGALEILIKIIQATGSSMGGAAKDSAAFGAIMDGIAVIFETVAVVGVNVKFVITQIINEVVGLSKQVAAIATGNFDEVGRIGDQMKAEAEAARRQVDMTTTAILNARKSQSMSYAETENDLKRLGNRWISTGSAAADAYAKELAAANKTKPAVTKMTGEQTKAMEKQKTAYEKLINDIQDKTGVMLLEEQQTGKLTDGQKQALKIMQDLQSGTVKLTDAQKKNLMSSLELMLATEDRIAKEKDLADTQQKAIALSAKLVDAQQKETSALADGNAQLRTQNDTLRLGEAAVRAREIAVLRSTATDLEFAAATYEGNEELAKQARLLRERADLLENNTVLEEAKKMAEEYKKTSESIETSLTDALMRGFESGKDFGKNLADTLVNMFKTLVLRPIIQPIAQGASNVILSLMGMGASGSAAAGGLSSAITLGGVSLSAIGSSLATGFMTTLSGGSVTAAASAYSAAGMTGVSSGLSAGAMAATAMPYVAAALVAANALGLMRSNKTVGGGITGTLGGELEEYDLNRRGGSLFRGPSYSATNMRVTETTEGINQAFEAIRDKSLAAAIALGSYNTGLETFTYTLSERLHPDLNELGLVLDGLTDDQKQEKIRGVLMAAEEAMAAIIVGATGLQLAGETAVETLNRLMVIQSASEMLNEFGGAFSNFATASITARQGIIELAGGLDALVQKTQGFVANFYSKEEQAGITARGIVVALESAGFTASQIAALETRADFRTLLESIDVSTDIGQQQFVALLDLQAAYSATVPIMEEQSATLLAIAEAAPQIEILQRMLETDAEFQQRVQTAEEMAQTTFDSMLARMGDVDISINNLTTIMAGRLDRLSNEMAAVQAQANAAAANAIAVANASAAAAIAAANAAALTAATAANQDMSGFAAMGGFIDGPTIVGEHGPELFDPRTSQIYTAPATSNIFGGNEVAAEIRALRDEVAMMRYETRSTAVNTAKIARLQDNWDVRGLTVRTDADQPLDTVTV